VATSARRSRIGVVVGLRAEARCLAGLDVAIGCSGARPERARAEAARLVAAGAAGLVSFGLAGGLSPALRAGDLVLAAAVWSGGRPIATDAAWRGRLAAALGPHVQACEGALAGSDRLLPSSAAKAALHRTSAACAVDMESHLVAEAASRAGLPFLVVRALADASSQEIPAAARHALGPDGAVRAAAVLGGLLRRPQDLAGLLRLGRDSARGLATLRRVAALAPPDLAFR